MKREKKTTFEQFNDSARVCVKSFLSYYETHFSNASQGQILVCVCVSIKINKKYCNIIIIRELNFLLFVGIERTQSRT